MHARTVDAELIVVFTRDDSVLATGVRSGTMVLRIRLSPSKALHHGTDLKCATGSAMYWPRDGPLLDGLFIRMCLSKCFAREGVYF